MAELTKSEQVAYDISAERTKKQAARNRGAAEALNGVPAGAVERARARALGQVETPAAPPSSGGSPSSGRIIQTPEGPVPEEFYDLSPEDQKRFRALVAEREEKDGAAERMDSTALQLLDLREKDSSRVRALEQQVATLLTVVEAQQRQISGLSTQIEVGKSEALLEQQAGIGQDVANLSAIRAETGAEMAGYNRQREEMAAENREFLEAQATAADAIRGSVKSSTTLMSERSNAVMDSLADAEGRQSRLGVQLQELEGRADALGTPITRAEMQSMVTDAVAEQWRAQQAGITDAVAEQLRDEYPSGLQGQRMDADLVRRQRSDAANYQDPVRRA